MWCFMLKKMTYRKVAVTVCALLTLVGFYLFPNNENKLNIKENVIYEEENNYEYIYMWAKKFWKRSPKSII